MALDLDILDLGYLGWNNSKFFFSFYTPGKYGEGERDFFCHKKTQKRANSVFFFLYSIDGNFKKSDFFLGCFF